MESFRFHREQWVPRSIEDVYAFHRLSSQEGNRDAGSSGAAMSEASGTLLWFRHDLRLTDNPALLAAVSRGGPVIPVFIWSPEEEGRWQPGSAVRWWLHQSLGRLDASLHLHHSRLIIRRGPTLETMRELLDQSGATAVYWNRQYEPALISRDSSLKAALHKDGLIAESFNGSVLFEPWTVRKQNGQPYQVFSAFWKACLGQPEPAPPQNAPSHVATPRHWPSTLKLADLCLEPTVDWTGGLRTTWCPGEAGAAEQLRCFEEQALAGYATARDQPDRPGTSRLSPHLHFGEISVRQIWFAVRKHRRGSGTRRYAEAIRVYARELGWREFARHLLYHFPHTPEQPLRKEFADFPWEPNRKALREWQRGRTGYPIVDAGMRELWQTGWMHNRVRMVVASFLVKDLLIPWQNGAAWFWDTLVDADLANNTLGWQWTAGCGADAAPYFRIFNPVIQGEKFDPNGDYVRRWIPELKKLPNAWVHKPWEAHPRVLADAEIELGRTYPRPIVDHQQARARALKALQVAKRSVT
jgi:deoxyribodipyrimidine photo-lyase